MIRYRVVNFILFLFILSPLSMAGVEPVDEAVEWIIFSEDQRLCHFKVVENYRKCIDSGADEVTCDIEMLDNYVMYCDEPVKEFKL